MTLMKRGTLKKNADSYKKLSNSILLGHLENEPFTDVEVVTLTQYARDCAFREVMDDPTDASSYEDLLIEVENLLDTKFKEAHEFISIEDERIVIGVDVEKVDERAVDKALLLLVELETFEAGAFHVFGEPITLDVKP